MYRQRERGRIIRTWMFSRFGSTSPSFERVLSRPEQGFTKILRHIAGSTCRGSVSRLKTFGCLPLDPP